MNGWWLAKSCWPKRRRPLAAGTPSAQSDASFRWSRSRRTMFSRGPGGRANLRDLFGPRRQLIVYHFMFDPAWDEGCKHCSHVADNFEGAVVHLAARDTAFAAISRAPFAKIESFKKRMGWTFPWLSSFAGDFIYDFHSTLHER